MKQTNIKMTLSSYMESLTNNLDPLSKEIEKLSTLILDKIENEGKVYFVSTGFTKSIVNNLFKALDRFSKVDYIKNIINISPADPFPEFIDENGPDFKSKKQSFEDAYQDDVLDSSNFKFKENDLIIAVSATGKTNILLDFLKELEDTQKDIVLISANKISFSYKEIIRNNSELSQKPLVDAFFVGELLTKIKIILDLLLMDYFQKIGFIYKNTVIPLKINCRKVNASIISLISTLFEVGEKEVKSKLKEYNDFIPHTLLYFAKGFSFKEANKILEENDFNLNKILKIDN